MHNGVNVMPFIWMPFFKHSPTWVCAEDEPWLILMCEDCGSVCFYANMNNVHGNDEEVEDNYDIEMYLNFWSMFCKPLIVQIMYSVSC